MRISYVPLILLHTNPNQYSRMIAKTDVALAKVLTKRWLESVIAFMDFLWGHYYSLPSLLKAPTKRFTRWTNRRLFVGEISGRCHHYQRVGGRAVDWIEEGGYWLVSNTASQRIADIKTSGVDSTLLFSLSPSFSSLAESCVILGGAGENHQNLEGCRGQNFPLWQV